MNRARRFELMLSTGLIFSLALAQHHAPRFPPQKSDPPKDARLVDQERAYTSPIWVG